MPEESRPVTAEARIRPLRSSDFAPVIAVIDEWWGGRPMARMLPRLFFDHFTNTSFAADRDGALAGFLVGFVSQSQPGDAYIRSRRSRSCGSPPRVASGSVICCWRP